MSAESLKAEDPSVVFGRQQGLFTYNMASSLTGHSNRPVIERARDAVSTAIQKFESPDIDAELAIVGLMNALQEDLNIAE